MVRSEATQALKSGGLSGWIAGEELGRGGSRARQMVRRLPALADIEVWQRENPGISVLVVR
jgi:hypothetical protein